MVADEQTDRPQLLAIARRSSILQRITDWHCHSLTVLPSVTSQDWPPMYSNDGHFTESLQVPFLWSYTHTESSNPDNFFYSVAMRIVAVRVSNRFRSYSLANAIGEGKLDDIVSWLGSAA